VSLHRLREALCTLLASVAIATALVAFLWIAGLAFVP
jgi:hypothetical protein